jgi:hypothetical protein
LRGFLYTVSLGFSAINKTVTLNVASFDYDAEDEDVKANVAFFELDEDGEVAEDAAADFEKKNADIKDGIVVVDVRTLADGDYKVVVTIGEEEQAATVVLEGFAEADELLDKVVKASSAATLTPLLEGNFDDYDEANIDEYVKKRNAEKTAGNLNTLADVQKLVIDAANAEDEAGAEFDNLVDEVKEAKTGLAKYNVIKLYFTKYVNDDNMDAYLVDVLEATGNHSRC